jgi:23S rRNA (cytidine1920-2'-O)/16S rRNA (cytidine1409-2'-O)-methyltransferase
MNPRAEGVALIKPQFEAGPGQVNKKGIIKDIATREKAIKKILDILPDHGLIAYGLTCSPVKGSDGNIEYLLWFGFDDKQGFARY